MAAQNPPYSMQTGAHGAELFRRAVGSVLNTAGGVVGLGDLLVTQKLTPSMNVNVAGGRPGGEAWVPGSTTTGQGLYYVYNDAVLNLAIAAANATNPRIDTVYAQVQDAAYAGATNAWQLAVGTGTPTAGATLANLVGAPALPASSLLLAYVLVPASSTSVITANIQDARVFANPNLPLRSNPTFSAYRSGALSITGATTAVVTFENKLWDNTASYSTANGQFVAPIAGYYQVSGRVDAGNTATRLFTTLRKNGIEINRGLDISMSGGAFVSSTLSATVYCAAGDYLQIACFSSATAALSVGAATCYFNGSLVSI